MNTAETILATLSILGTIMFILGYLIKYHGMIQLIAGVLRNEERIIDKRKFGSIVGLGVMSIGVTLVVMGISTYLIQNNKTEIEAIGLSIIGIVFLGTIYSARKYTKA